MRVTGRQGSTVAVVASGALVAGMCGLPAAQAAPAIPSAAADLQPVLPVKSELPDPWAAKAGNGVAFAGKARSRVEDEGDRMKVVLSGVGQGVRTRPNGASSGLLRKSLGGAWRGLDGNAMKGVLTGRTTGGATVSIPVRFSKRISVGKRTVVVYAFPAGGPLNEHVEDAFPALGGVKERAVGAKFRYLSVFATDADSRAWRFTGAGSSGRIAEAGDGVTVRVAKPGDRGVGVQMNDGAASLPWDHIAKHWDKIAGRGVAPTVVVSGIGRKNRVRTITVRPESLSSGKSLVIKGQALAGYKETVKRDLRTLRGVSVTLVASNAGHDTRYVVITGDSISSGESGRYIADYESATWIELAGVNPLDYVNFCRWADLACTRAERKGDRTLSPFDYDQQLTNAYEKGSQKASECHRSYSAPGTWLARYFKVEQGDDVESINIACSGATTRAMTESFNKQLPQATELGEIADFLYVPYVTNTMGANDIGFSSVAIGCYLKVAEPFLGGGSAADLLNELGGLVDAPWNPWFGFRKVKGEERFEKVNPYCHNDPDTGGKAEDLIRKLPGRYESAMRELMSAAPMARIVAHNYPNLIPHNSQSNMPREQAINGVNPRGDLDEQSSFFGFNLITFGSPPAPTLDVPTPDQIEGNDPAWTYQRLRKNQEGWNAVISQNVTNTIALLASPNSNWGNALLATVNLLYRKDMNWAAWKMIPDLNDAVYNTADGMGERVIPVDMRQVLNGREYTTRYKGGPSVDDGGTVLDSGLNGQSHMGYGAQSGEEILPEDLRATFVTGPLAGLPYQVPILCPNGVTLNSDRLPDGTCLGEMNEPLHPNWRGQAAQGQCLVSVVTGMAGEGNACVRSVGNNEVSLPESSFLIDGYLKKVDQADRLCVTAKPRDDYDWKEATPADPYTECDSNLSADPTWDTKRWDLVEQYGNWR